MILYNTETANHSRILVNRISETADFYLQKLELTEFDIEELNKYLIEKRKLQWYASRYTLKKLLDKPEMIYLNKDEYGKPFLENFPIHISLSHTQQMVVAMSNEQFFVGVDVEQIKDKVKRIAHKFTTEYECEFMQPNTELETLITIWSAKESIYKMYSQKQLDFKEHILLEPFEFQGNGKIQARLVKNDLDKKLIVNYTQIEDHILTYIEDISFSSEQN